MHNPESAWGIVRASKPIRRRNINLSPTAAFSLPAKLLMKYAVYAADLAGYGYLDRAKNQLRIPMHYVLKNDEANGLGRFPLRPGKVRIFQNDGHGTSS